jgi:hypothetical protein
MDMGGGISSFSLLSPPREILNAADEGRMIQQSWYGDNDGSNWGGTPWVWNPIQGGCWQGVRGIVLASSRVNKTLYVKTQPVNWGGCNTINAPMEEWIRLAGRVAHIHFKFVNNDRDNTSFRDQEMPAVFMDYSLRTLVYYKGAAPWTNNAALVRRNAPSGTGSQFGDILTEDWLAYVDGTDWGAGVYAPGTSKFTSYWIDQTCAYFAPIRDYTINKGFTLEYDLYVYIGTLSAMRNEFDYINKNGRPSVPYDSELPVASVANLALDAMVTGCTSLENGDWGVAKLTDGVTTSVTGSLGYTSDPPQTGPNNHECVTIDLGANTLFNRLILYPRTGVKSTTGGAPNWPANFTIQVKPDGGSYAIVQTVTNDSNNTAQPKTYNFTGQNARYIKIDVTKLGVPSSDETANYRFQLAEVEAYNIGTVSTSPRAVGIVTAKAPALTLDNGRTVFHIACRGAYALRVFDAVGNMRAIYRGHDQGSVAVASTMLVRGVYFAQLAHAQGSATIKFVAY